MNKTKIQWVTLDTILVKGIQFTVEPGKQYQYERYSCSFAHELSDVYDTWSNAKEDAMRYCKTLERDCNGYNGKILSHTDQCFTYGFIVTDEDYYDYLVVITPHKQYVVPVGGDD